MRARLHASLEMIDASKKRCHHYYILYSLLSTSTIVIQFGTRVPRLIIEPLLSLSHTMIPLLIFN